MMVITKKNFEPKNKIPKNQSQTIASYFIDSGSQINVGTIIVHYHRAMDIVSDMVDMSSKILMNQN